MELTIATLLIMSAIGGITGLWDAYHTKKSAERRVFLSEKILPEKIKTFGRSIFISSISSVFIKFVHTALTMGAPVVSILTSAIGWLYLLAVSVSRPVFFWLPIIFSSKRDMTVRAIYNNTVDDTDLPVTMQPSKINITINNSSIESKNCLSNFNAIAQQKRGISSKFKDQKTFFYWNTKFDGNEEASDYRVDVSVNTTHKYIRINMHELAGWKQNIRYYYENWVNGTPYLQEQDDSQFKSFINEKIKSGYKIISSKDLIEKLGIIKEDSASTTEDSPLNLEAKREEVILNFNAKAVVSTHNDSSSVHFVNTRFNEKIKWLYQSFKAGYTQKQSLSDLENRLKSKVRISTSNHDKSIAVLTAFDKNLQNKDKDVLVIDYNNKIDESSIKSRLLKVDIVKGAELEGRRDKLIAFFLAPLKESFMLFCTKTIAALMDWKLLSPPIVIALIIREAIVLVPNIIQSTIDTIFMSIMMERAFSNYGRDALFNDMSSPGKINGKNNILSANANGGKVNITFSQKNVNVGEDVTSAPNTEKKKVVA